jgi:hypothetical protein
VLALVMGLIEGKTLADQLARGPMPLANSVRIAHQIADALDAAHSTGVVHRDLKLANVMINAAGVVKVLMALFRYAGVYRMSGTAIPYDVHPDGKRFIMVSEAEGSGDAGMRQQVNVILNWLDELKQRVAPAR